MEESILKSTKKVLNIGIDDPTFDLDVLTHINSAFSTLNDLGVGAEIGFTVEDDTAVWEDFLLGEENQVQRNYVKTFVLLSVRLVFDPPATSYVLAALQKQLEEITWRLNVKREETDWVDPDPGYMVIDGGDPSEG
jgi:hypothetical protein